MSDKGTEISTNLIINHIRDNIQAALDEVATERAADPLTSGFAVTVQSPASYATDYDERAYRKPTCFVLSGGIDYRIESGANFNNGIEQIFVVIVVEERDRDHTTVSGWRYQSALSKLFRKTQLVSLDGTVKLITKLARSSFSEVLPKEEIGPEGEVFRQEMVLELQVEHYQNY